MFGIGLYMGPSNLDREYRCDHGSIGCTGSGYPWTALPNNTTIMVLSGAFGFARGTYHGPYPYEKEAWYSIEDSSETVSLEQMQSGILILEGDQRVEVDSSLFPRRWFGKYPFYKVAVFENECLLIAGGDTERGTRVILVDVATGEPFAGYFTNLDYLGDAMQKLETAE